jgi:hypothetical protein
LYVEDPSNSFGSLLKKSATVGTGGWWLGSTHMIPNNYFLTQVRLLWLPLLVIIIMLPIQAITVLGVSLLLLLLLLLSTAGVTRLTHTQQRCTLSATLHRLTPPPVPPPASAPASRLAQPSHNIVTCYITGPGPDPQGQAHCRGLPEGPAQLGCC